MNVNSFAWRGPTSTKPTQRAATPLAAFRQHPIVGEPGAAELTAARAPEPLASIRRATVARTGWATLRGAEERRVGEAGAARDDGAAAPRRRRRRSSSRHRPEARAIVVCFVLCRESVSWPLSLFLSPEEK